MPHNIKPSNSSTEILIPTINDNPHLLKILEHFGDFTTNHPPEPEGINYLFICYTNRSGSNYLAELMESSGQYNLAGEDLNWETALDHKNIYHFNNFHEYFNHLVQSKQKSGTFILKTAISHIELLGESGILDKIIHRSKFLVIQRGDKLGQAISHALAFSTGKYTSWMEGTKSPEEIDFSAPMITQILQDILEAEHQYGEFFALNGIIPTYLTYEQIVAAPLLLCPLIATQVGLNSFTPDLSKIKLARQANAVNDRWRSQFLASRNASSLRNNNTPG
jgi:LPS sulfotransferase NodH